MKWRSINGCFVARGREGEREGGAIICCPGNKGHSRWGTEKGTMAGVQNEGTMGGVQNKGHNGWGAEQGYSGWGTE